MAGCRNEILFDGCKQVALDKPPTPKSPNGCPFFFFLFFFAARTLHSARGGYGPILPSHHRTPIGHKNRRWMVVSPRDESAGLLRSRCYHATATPVVIPSWSI